MADQDNRQRSIVELNNVMHALEGYCRTCFTLKGGFDDEHVLGKDQQGLDYVIRHP